MGNYIARLQAKLGANRKLSRKSDLKRAVLGSWPAIHRRRVDGWSSRLWLRCSEGHKHPSVAERSPPDANTGRVVDCICDRRERRLQRRFPAAIRRQVGAVWIGIAIHQHDIDPLRSVGVAESRMRHPVHARDFFSVELHFFMKRPAQPRMVKIFDLFDALRLANSAGLVAPAIGFKKKDVFKHSFGMRHILT